ncbi:MAG: hypothetical protein K5945_08585, partial [Bacteroidaceae bacterium]|nr:hypothetical protein [Bacteroidaceae bacterium]
MPIKEKKVCAALSFALQTLILHLQKWFDSMQKGVFLILMAMATLPSFSAKRGLSRKECVEVQEQVINSWMAREREAGNAILALPDSARAVSSSLATMPF